MELDQYLARIGYNGPVAPELSVLRAVHRAHACNIPYENLDVLLQRPVTQDPAQIYRKIVDDNRGGWCYEMNGLLGWALSEIGFNVKRLCGGVMRAASGDEAFGNHLVLLVNLDGTDWIADVGLGDGILEPIALIEGEHTQFGRIFRLEQLEPSVWRFHNRNDGLPPSADFHAGADTEERLAETCATLQSNPESMFRQNLICQRMSESGGWMLLGRVLRQFEPGAPRRLINSESELLAVLADTFGIRMTDVGDLWPRVLARHEALFGDTPVDEIHFGPPPAAQ